MKKTLAAISAVLLSAVFIFGIVFASGTTDYKVANETPKDNLVQELPVFTVKNASVDENAVNTFVERFKTKDFSYEKQMCVESYVNFLAFNTLTQNELEQINNLVSTGTPMGTIHNIYEFYLTTNDDFSIIPKIASYEEKYYGKNWIENAYNDITDKKHGVIERDKAGEYLTHFTNSEILYANVLSRKGIFTIDEVLNKHKDGMSWNELTDVIYSSALSEKAVGSVKQRIEVETYLKNDIFDYSSSPYEVHKFAYFCALNGITVKEAVISSENISACYKTVYEELDKATEEQINRILKNTGFEKSMSSAREYAQYNEKYYNMAMAAGMTQTDMVIFEDKGFSMQEIAESAALFKNDPCAMIEHIKSERGDMLK